MPSPRKKAAVSRSATPEAIFGQIVREKRLALGLRQVDLVTEDGVSQVHIGRIEAGKTQVCLKGIIQIAEGLEMSIVELMGEFEKRRLSRR